MWLPGPHSALPLAQVACSLRQRAWGSGLSRVRWGLGKNELTRAPADKGRYKVTAPSPPPWVSSKWLRGKTTPDKRPGPEVCHSRTTTTLTHTRTLKGQA